MGDELTMADDFSNYKGVLSAVSVKNNALFYLWMDSDSRVPSGLQQGRAARVGAIARSPS
jgi:hypothetical protein